MVSGAGYRVLVGIAVVLALVIGCWVVWDTFFDVDPADRRYLAGNTLFADQFYDRAADAYREALAIDPEHIFALRGLARSLHRMGQSDDALILYDRVIEWEPEFGASFANRGILLDTMGKHEEALQDYEKALSLDPELGEGPSWITRFLRNQAEAPPTIADRAGYLRQELAKPVEERVLRIPEIDAEQRPYKQ